MAAKNSISDLADKAEAQAKKGSKKTAKKASKKTSKKTTTRRKVKDPNAALHSAVAVVKRAKSMLSEIDCQPSLFKGKKRKN